VTAVTGEVNMGEGQVSKKAKRHILSPALLAASKDTRGIAQVSVSLRITDRKGGYVD